MRLSLIPRNYRFYDLFEESAKTLVEGGEVLADLFEHFENVEMKVGRLRDLEHQADNITHDLYTLSHQTFVTPLDREDIAALTQQMDDVMDHMEEAAALTLIYGIEEPTAAARGLSDIVRLQCLQIERAVSTLRKQRQLSKIHDQLTEINRLENEGDSLLRNATGEMFRGEMAMVEIIKWRDIYEHLEAATDSAEHVSHVLEAIILKHA